MIKNSTRGLLLLALSLGACARTQNNPEGFQGIVEFEERHLGFELGGRVAALPVAEGDIVKPGELLARLDDSLTRPARDAREAELRAARANVQLLRAGARSEDIRVAEAQLRAARQRVIQLSRNLEQQRQLASRGAAGTAGVSDLEDELSRARDDEAALTQKVRLLRSGARPEEIEAAEARVQGAEAALAAETVRLERHALLADGPGTVLDVPVEVGEVVPAGATVATIADTTHPFVDVFVPQADIGKVALGDGARVRVDGLAEPLAGRVEHLGRATEFTPKFLFSPRERPHLVIRVRVRVDDPGARLRAGMPAFVTVGGVAPPPAAAPAAPAAKGAAPAGDGGGP